MSYKYHKLIAQSTFITSDERPRRRGQGQGHDFFCPRGHIPVEQLCISRSSVGKLQLSSPTSV